ncbi:MAG: zinc-ribbon and DUF3426 domain-containing protein [Thiobacillus sp.]|nr:zinc-ribbon and DUF3426 domain-containing protein [Thiobacillus sp.]MDP2979605.1 zinc-ribbon and DUF3426 domain-containing protein [Thiobacillus sp.]
MTYRTTCPQCASAFRLGADKLDAAQGWVQCSVCGAAFDAYLSLLMEDGSPLSIEAEPIAAPASPDAAPPAGLEAAGAEPAMAAQTPAAVPDTEDVEITDIPRGIAQREVSLDLPSIILIDPDVEVSDDPGPLPQFHPAPAYPSASEAPAYPFIPVAPVAARPPAARIEYATPLPGAAHLPAAPRRIKPWAWGVASALLLVLVLTQSAYFLRDTLVSRLPQTRPAFEQACAVLGCTLSLPKNLALLQIVGSDLKTEAGGRLSLTLTLGNRAGHAQAWPIFELTLTDLRDRPIARRSFAPSEYLDDARRIEAGIPAQSEQTLKLELATRDLAAAGFKIRPHY